MTQVDEGLLQAYADKELPADERARVDRLIEADDALRGAVAKLRRNASDASSALGTLDVLPPTDAARQAILRRMQEGEAGTAGPDESRPVRPRRQARSAPLGRAALWVLAGSAVVASSLPGSPVQGWFGRGWSALSGRAGDAPAEITAPPAAETAAPATGVRVAPVDGRLRIVLTGMAAGAELQLAITDRADAGIYGDAATRFRIGEGVAEAVVSGSTIRIELPRIVERVTVDVNGRTLVEKVGDDVRIIDAAADTVDAEIHIRVPG